MLLRDMIRRCAENFPTRTAYICGSTATCWREMHKRSDRIGAALQAIGIAKGDAVATLCAESVAIYETFFACAKIGAVRIGLNTQYAPAELRHVILDSGVKAIVIDARNASLMANHRAELQSRGIALIGVGGPIAGVADLETTISDALPDPVLPNIAPDDILLISYTSGTTGAPKGAMLTHGGVVNVIVQTLTGFGLTRDDIWSMPAASAWAIVIMGLLGLGNAMTTVIPDGGFEIERYLDDVERHLVTATVLVPTMLQRVLAAQIARPRDIASLRLVVYGSAPATPRLIKEAQAELGVHLIQAYGQTESTGGWMVTLTDADHRRGLTEKPELLRAAGQVSIHYECTIRDEAGNILPPEQSGEVWLRGNSVMKGYLNLPVETGEVLRDGWLRSNDIGMLDQDGYLYLLDRQKFMIITGAVNVYPSAVEAVLSEHPAIAEVAVVGVPHPEWGEAVVAVIVQRPDMVVPGTDEVRHFCQGNLSRAELPKHVLMVEQLPKTVHGKVRKAEIRDWLTNTPGLVPWSIGVAG